MPDGEGQTPEELAMHYGPAGPVMATTAFLWAISERDATGAWPLLDGNLRLVLIQAWLWANREWSELQGRGLEDVAAELIQGPTPDSTLWNAFWSTTAQEFADGYRDPLELFAVDRLGAASRPRLRGIDLELIIWVPIPSVDQPLHFDTGPVLIEGALPLLVRHTGDGWRIAGFGDEPPYEPGWPPVNPRTDRD